MDKRDVRVGGLFDGCGLMAYGLGLAGFEHAFLCELDEFRRGILRLRYPGVPVYPDVRTLEPAGLPGVDLMAFGFPCKGVSSAGKREGFGHPETALWREALRIVRGVRPRYVLVENVADLLSLQRGALFGEVLGGLAESGYDAEWDCFPAAAFGAPHGRDRVFVTAVAGAECGVHAPAGRGDVPGPEVAREGEGPERQRLRADAADGAQSAADSSRSGQRTDEQDLRPRRGEPDAARSTSLDAAGEGRAQRRKQQRAELAWSRDLADEGLAPAAESASERRPAATSLDGQRGLGEAAGADARGVRLEWAGYAEAIARWEGIVGRPAPEPLVRRVDDGSARRVERSRLSALGDGVLTQAAWLCGKRILLHAQETGYA